MVSEIGKRARTMLETLFTLQKVLERSVELLRQLNNQVR
jgi:hypothetical protein